VTDGGLNRGFAYGGRADIVLNIDGEKAGLWKGFFVTLHDETIYGNSVNFSTGALSPVNTAQFIPIPSGSTNALTGVKFTQFLSENFCVTFGKLNMFDDFKQPFAGYRGVDGFMNMSMILPLMLARTVPYSTFGGGFAVLRELEPVLTFLVLDTNNTPTVSGFNTFFDNGTTLLAQANLPTNFFGLKGHQGIGGTYSNRRYAALDDLPYLVIQALRGQVANPAQETGSWSVFYLFDQTLGSFGCDEKRTWGLFGNAGISDGNPNPVRWNATIGFGGSSPFAARPLDSFGVAYYYLGLSDTLKNLGRANNINILGNEQGIETYYTVGITSWCKFTADLQVVNPVRQRVETDIVFGIRGKIDF
jgi:porin